MVKFEAGKQEWGCLVAFSLVIVLVATLTPMVSMGLIFGDFAQQNGKQTTDLVVINVIVLSASHLIGIVTTPLLKIYSAKTVALIGAALVILGNFLTISVNNFYDLLVYYALFQGFGIGILIPAHFAVLQSYFTAKLTLVVSLIYIFSALFSIIYPTFIVYLLQTYGFRPALFVLAAITLTTIPTSLILYPSEIEQIANETQSLLGKPKVKFFDRFSLKLFTNPIFLNISVGLSLGFTADYAFFTIAPIVLKNANFSLSQVGFLLTIPFIGDLFATSALALVNSFRDLSQWNRKIYFVTCIVAIGFRSVFIYFEGIEWKIAALAILGGARALTHTPITVIIAENFPDNFSSAYSLYRVVCGCTTLILGGGLYFVTISSEVILIHLLNGANAVCVFSWLCEGIARKTHIF